MKTIKDSMAVDSHIDYLTVSYVTVKRPTDLGFLAGGIFGAKESIKPFPHYDSAFKLNCGGVLNLSDDSLQGSRLDLSGEPLQWLRDRGLNDAQILMITGDNELKKRTTRIDYAWDIMNAGSVRHVVNHWKAKKCVTTFRNAPQGYVNYGSRKAQTAYFGSKAGEQFVRIYDKGSEMRLLSEALLRVELQVRNPHAGEFYGDCIKSSVKVAARSRLLSVLDFPALAWWRKAIYGETCDTGKVPRKQPKWQHWMNSQVKSSIVDHWNENSEGDREFIENFVKEIRNLID